MNRSFIALALVALISAWPADANAVGSCGGQKDNCKCGKSNPYPCCSNGGNCTWWAWQAACCSWKVGPPSWGNANQWAGNAKANSWYEVRKSPVAGSIAVRVSGSYGHVAWVTKVSGSKITVSEMACWGFSGKRTYTYSASYFDGGFIVRKNQCACTPGKKQSQKCGNCGNQSRTCASSCKWGGYGGCTGEGICASGTVDKEACGKNGARQRTCGKDCKWGTWGSCVERDGGVVPPDLTGPGHDLTHRDKGGRDKGQRDLPSSVESGPPDMPGATNGATYSTLKGGCRASGPGGNPGAALPLLLLLILRRRRLRT